MGRRLTYPGRMAHFLRRAGRAFALSDPLQAGNTVLNILERSAQRTRLRSFPLVIQAEVTNRCNLNCVFCLRDRGAPSQGDLPAELVSPIGSLSRRAREMVLFGFGEPLVSPSFFSLLRAVRSGRVSFTTNGSLLTDETVDRILGQTSRPLYSVSFSIDANHPATYRSIRQGPGLEQVWNNLRRLVDYKRRERTRWPEIWINFVAMQRNVKELPGLVRQAAQSGVSRINVFHLVVWNPSYQEESLIYEPDLTRQVFGQAKATAAEVGIHLDLPVEIFLAPSPRPVSVIPRCHHPWSYAYIRFDGTVQGCCYSERLAMGNLREKRFEEIWNGETYRHLRESVNRNPSGDCRRCEMRFRYVPSPDDRETYFKCTHNISSNQ